jgi:hypothetical protein
MEKSWKILEKSWKILEKSMENFISNGKIMENLWFLVKVFPTKTNPLNHWCKLINIRTSLDRTYNTIEFLYTSYIHIFFMYTCCCWMHMRKGIALSEANQRHAGEV